MTAWPMIRKCLDHQYWSTLWELPEMKARVVAHELARMDTVTTLVDAGYRVFEGALEGAYDFPGMLLLDSAPGATRRDSNNGIVLPILMIKTEQWLTRTAEER